MPEHIYFELQTGIVKDRPFRSNFYIYRLPASCLAKVELAVSEAGLTSSGLYYSPEFIEWLTKKDTVKACRKSPGECGACGNVIEIGQPYKWAKGRYTAKKIRCEKC